ncbi:MAG: hypothetical protein FK730_17225 [Asgard group archaeon]|nr:hypothetical protein [Asgard group archaeon]
MRNLKGILGLLVIGAVIFSTQNSIAITQSLIFQGREGSVVELKATIETTNLNEGEHVLGVEIILVSLGDKVRGIDFIIVYFRIGEFSSAIDFSQHQLSPSTEALQQTTTFVYDKEWDEVMLEISLLFFEETQEEDTFPDNMHYSDYQPYFKVIPKRFLRENQYIFFIAIVFVIAVSHFSAMRWRKRSLKSRNIMFSCAKCGFESKVKVKRNPHSRIFYSCPNCSFNKYNMHLMK